MPSAAQESSIPRQITTIPARQFAHEHRPDALLARHRMNPAASLVFGGTTIDKL
jgi:hypothetical protein